ncbi:MAG: hypothetical protein J6Z23_07435 [Lachnospiraceae bacterium]|nr:hypothetical protein [Lachnospiraceae bacterium]
MLTLVLKSVMLIFLGFPFPVLLFKALRARTAKGQSILFLTVTCIGFAAGLFAELFSPGFLEEIRTNWILLALYGLNLFFVLLNIATYYNNLKIDQNNGRD